MDRQSGAMTNVSAMPEGVTGGMWSADGRFLYGVAMHDGTKNTVYQFGFNGDRVVLIPAPEASASRPGAALRPINHFRDDPERGLIFYEQVDGALYAAGGSIGTYDKRTGETRHYIRRPGGALAPALKDYITPHRAARHQLATAARVHPGPEPAGGFYFLKGSG